MSDTISRQAAIDTLENTKTAISENGERYIAKQNAIMRIDALPSAQPEIIRCKDCKHYKYGICKKAGLCVNKSPNGFCDWGERREEGET